jgi:WD40 repeat protein
MIADPAKSNLFLVASNASPSAIQPYGLSSPKAGTILMTPGTATPSGAGAGPIAISDALIFTGDSTSVSYYTYTGSGVVGPASSVPLPTASFAVGPSSFAVDKTGQNLYVGFNDPNGGYVQPFVVSGGAVQAPNTTNQVAVSSFNFGGVTALALSPNGNLLFAACSDGTVTAYTVSGQTLTANPNAAQVSAGMTPSTGGIAIDPTGTFLVCANNDDSNSVVSFSFDPSGNMTQIGNPYASAGTGPNCVVFSPSGTVVYVTNGGNATISALKVSASSGPSPLGGSPFALPKGDTGPGVLVVK